MKTTVYSIATQVFYIFQLSAVIFLQIVSLQEKKKEARNFKKKEIKRANSTENVIFQQCNNCKF